MKALVLAAGLGSRLGLSIPKPMYKINDKPVLEHNILLLKKFNITDIYVNLHFMPDVIKNYFGDGSKLGVKIQYSFEKELLGTSGAVKNIENFWDKESFFVIYGDNYTNINLQEMLDFHKSNKSLATIALFDPKKSLNSGIAGGVIMMDGKNNLISFAEGKENEINGYVNAGVYVLESEILGMIPGNCMSDFGKNIFPELLNKGFNVKGYLTDSFVFAVDTNEALKATEKALKTVRQYDNNQNSF